jgi:hypothetical protein
MMEHTQVTLPVERYRPRVAENFDTLSAGFDTPIWGQDTFAGFLTYFDSHYPGVEYMTVQLGAEIVGVFALIPFEHPDLPGDRFNCETLIYLIPSARRKGILKGLAHAAGIAARIHKVNLWADVRTTNEASVAAHLKMFPNLKPTVHKSPEGYSTYRWLISDPANDLYCSRWMREECGLAIMRLQSRQHKIDNPDYDPTSLYFL